MKEAIEHPIFTHIQQASQTLQMQSYVVGGFVRDYLLGKTLKKDIDIVSTGDGILLAQAVAERLALTTPIKVYKQFGTAALFWEGLAIEFVGARKESYRGDSRKPVVEQGTIAEDQQRRDFTINALSISLNTDDLGQLIDPFGGIDDLAVKCIRTPLDPDITYSDDPLRMMRAIRFSTQLGFTIHPNSLASIVRNKERIGIISMERTMDEFNKILADDKPSHGLKLLFQSGLLALLLPELTALHGVDEIEGNGHKDNFYHTLQVVDNIAPHTDQLWLRWAALLHDIGKARTKRYDEKIGWTFHGHEFVGSKMIPSIFKRLKLPHHSLKYVCKIVMMSSRPIALVEDDTTDSAVRRLLFDAGDDLDDLFLLCNADITTKNEMRKRQYQANFQKVKEKVKKVEARDHIRNFQPPISGEEIMQIFALSPGRAIGQLKESIKNAILSGEIPNDYDAAHAYMLQKGKAIGLEIKES